MTVNHQLLWKVNSMTTNPKPVYQRILLKLSGEALQGEEGFGIDPTILGPYGSRSEGTG